MSRVLFSQEEGFILPGLPYFYGNEAEQFSFYRIPKVLFTNPYCQSMPIEVKLLYSLMLDRANLSARNGWADDHGKVYIYFPEQNAAAMLGCSRAKAIRLFKALDTFGLIERRKQGQGRPDRIYVKDIARFTAQSESEHESMTLQPLEKTMYKPTAEIQSLKVSLLKTSGLNVTICNS